MTKKGISLIILVITIIVVIIIATAVILTMGNNNILDKSKKAKFMSDYTNVQEGVNLYSLGKYNADTTDFELPLKGYLSSEDKTYISENLPTLKTKIEELSGSIDGVNLAWISSENIGAKLSKEKVEKGYIIDVDSWQIYDYNGDYFEGKMWHTLDGGVVSDKVETPKGPIVEELWDGWIKLTLYYPSSSTERKWRLGTEGELRVDPMLMWQNYTGPITIPLDRVKDVWIKYILDNKEVVIPPAGTLLVDITPDKTGYTKVPGVKVNISFDETATVKEYRVGDSGWITYNGEFTVTENCIIEARAKKTETIYSADGSLLATRDIAGRDLVYIGNIGIEETELPAPIITRLTPLGTEKARVKVTYPAEATRKIYKVNYGMEENYTTEINVGNYGTYIIAYYYDASGKRSKASSIRINDTTNDIQPEDPEAYNPLPPHNPGDPTPPYNPGTFGINVPAPQIDVDPTSVAEEVQVSINVPTDADNVYIKLGRYSEYQLYTSPITVRENMQIYAYYRTYSGERSDTGYGVVNNIKKNNMPYVSIDANPYPWSWSYGASQVTVTVNYSDANIIEYSEDGIVYVPYTAPFVIKENKKIYARATNAYGVEEASLNITNIGKITPPATVQNLYVGISVNPEPLLSTSRVMKVNVTIDYDSKATEKYYSIGKYGTLKPYNGSFEITNNCTIYAYAKGSNAKGQTSKIIDNLSGGISQPIISAVPGNSEQASKVSINIEYDKYATIKRYSINGGTLRDYIGEFEITTNESVIYAYSENELGQKSESSYTINNIVANPPVLLLDKGAYYLLKLNYPDTAKNKEYKWKVNGVWNQYKDAGILLIKPQFKDQLLQNGVLVKIEDENGNLITFTGDYYLIDVPISELFENLFMRWDRVPPGIPQIVLNTTEPAKEVTVTIVYDATIIKKQYKIINPDGSVNTDWADYTKPIKVDRNNTIIYARGMDEAEVWSSEGIKKITNIDENPPVINLTADLNTATRKVAVKINVTDDVGVGKIKWAAGIQGESYFTSYGTEIENNSIVNITSNGYYTFFAEDKVGNKQVYTLNVTNVDLVPPLIDISVSPENVIGLTTNITIDYGDSTIKQYKVGTSNATWSTYTNTFAISSYTVLANNWQNADGTVTIYAKGKDSAGNEIIVTKKIMNLDLDILVKPIIVSSIGYPILTEYGVKIDSSVNITYDTRTDINNYYSIDNGVTWNLYTGTLFLDTGNIIAKSVKKDTGLEVSVSKTIAITADSITSLAYDNNDTTYMTNVTNKYMQVDITMQNKLVRIRVYDTTNSTSTIIRFMNESRQEISNFVVSNTTYDGLVTVPLNTKWIRYDGATTSGTSRLYEIQPSNEPKFSAVNGYMLLHSDTTKAIKSPYQMVTVNYFPTSVQKLYRIGTTGDWYNYTDQAVRVLQGQTIYSKGIDKNGIETRIVSSYTVNVTDAITSVAFDNNDTTYMTNTTGRYMEVDNSMQGKNVRIKAYDGINSTSVLISFLDKDKKTLSSFYVSNPSGTTITYDNIHLVPLNTKWIKYDGATTDSTSRLYEVQPSNEPTISIANVYMLLHEDYTKRITDPYQMITLTYFPTSIQRLYRIGTSGNWLNYADQPVRVNQGQTIYAKGIDKYGNDTRIISSYTSSMPDAIKKEAFDGDVSTYVYNVSGQYMSVDASMQGKNVRIKAYDGINGVSVVINFLNESKAVISSLVIGNPSGTTITYDNIYKIPLNTKWITYSGATSSNTSRLYEIQPVDLSTSLMGYIPKMTTNIAPSPFVITASSIYNTTTANSFTSFDRTVTETYGWISLANDINDGNAWLSFKLDKPIHVSKYYIISRNDSGLEQSPKNWQLQGSIDGTNWINVDERTDQINWKFGEVRWFTTSYSGEYQYYRIYITANNGLSSGINYVTIDEMNIFE
jgi:hypothetical protein